MPLTANIKRNGCSLDFHQTHVFCEILAINIMVLFENTVK